MQEIRLTLPLNVHSAKKEAKTLTDWKFYVGNFPLFVLPAVSAIAYLLVPEKKRVLPSQNWVERLPSIHVNGPKEKNEQVQTSYLAGVGSVFAGIALKAISTYATQKLTSSFNEHRSSTRART